MGWIREQIDKFVLSDFEWKKKYCPYLHHYLFSLTEEERSKIFNDSMNNLNSKRKICNECNGIYFEEKCPECNGIHLCGGYVIEIK